MSGFRWLQLVKIRISLLAAVSSFIGYMIYSNTPDIDAMEVSLGVFFLACGAGAMNHYQDRFVDRLFSRTRNRPLPGKLISPPRVLFFSACLMFLGLAVIYLSRSSHWAWLTGMAAVLCYNGLYTPLKKRTNLAMIPGMFCGMIPPLIGWVAAGGPVASPQIIVLMGIWGLWQLPHFWLLILNNQKEYRESDVPNMLHQLSGSQLKRILLVWIFGFACLSFLLPVVDVLINPWAHWLLAAGLFPMTAVFTYFLLLKDDFKKYSHLFAGLNYTMGFILTLIFVDRLIILSF
jgi:protoheme IX farnesyltransferase